MTAIGEAVKLLGIGLAALALATAAAGLVLRLIMLVSHRDVPRNLAFLGFRSYLVVMIGAQIAILGAIIEGQLPWPFLLSLLVFGMPAVVALFADLPEWPARAK